MNALFDNVPDVVLEDLYTAEGRKAGWKGLFYSDGTFLGVASPRYRPVTKAMLADFAQATLNYIGGLNEVKVSWTPKAYTLEFSPSAESRRIDHDNGSLFARLVIVAPHDKQAVCVRLGAYRDVCRNLLLASPQFGADLRVRHDSRLPERLFGTIDEIGELVARWPSVVDSFRSLNERVVDLRALVAAVFDEPAEPTERQKRRIERRFDRIISRAVAENVDINRVTAWQALNAVQGFMQHDARRFGISQMDRIWDALAVAV